MCMSLSPDWRIFELENDMYLTYIVVLSKKKIVVPLASINTYLVCQTSIPKLSYVDNQI